MKVLTDTGVQTLWDKTKGLVANTNNNTIESVAARFFGKSCYPDIPENRVTIKRFSGQESGTVVIADNEEMINQIFSLFFPCLIDRNSNIVAYLNGNDVTKTIDGLTVPLNDYSMPCMVRLGGYYRKYEYDAITNTKIEKYSIYPVIGYKYIRRRFFPMYAGEVETQGGKKILTSNAEKWSTQNLSIQQFHEYAKNMGDNFRAIAIQDFNEYRKMFFMWKRSYNSQSFYGISNFNWNKWSATPNKESGKTSAAQPYINGVTKTIKGMEGQLAEQTFTYKDNTTVTYKPYRFLWAEGFLAGPFWIRCSGALKMDHKWYVAKDINTCVSWDPTDDNHKFVCDACKDDGYITENFEDTMFPTQVGGSDSKGLFDFHWGNKTDVTSIFVPAVCGASQDGASAGISAIRTGGDLTGTNFASGSALASDDPTDIIPDGTVVV